MEVLSLMILASVFAFGTIIGSFLNCWIWRFGAGESVMSGRSRCPKCDHELGWRDLAPVLSFIFLRRKCRYCKKPISWQYPAVELATGFLFAAALWAFAPILAAGYFFGFEIFQLFAWWTILAALVVVFVADLRWYLIPDAAVAAGIAGAAVLRAARFFENKAVFHRFDAAAIIDPLLAAAFAGLFFLAIFLGSRGKWLGFGDVKLAVLMGLLLGFPAILTALFLGNFFGAIIGLGLIAAGRKKMSSVIPFGPFLAAGTVAALFFSNRIVDWYLSIGI